MHVLVDIAAHSDTHFFCVVLTAAVTGLEGTAIKRLSLNGILCYIL